MDFCDISSVNTLLKKRRIKEKLNVPLLTASPVIFLFSTIHIWGVWVRTYKAFITYPTGPADYFGLITTTEKTITQVGQVGAVIVADATTVYRAFVVWGGNYFVVIVPTLTFLATFVGAVGFITAQHRVNVHTSIFSRTVTQWTEAWLGASLATTAICTLLIVYKLLSTQRNLRKAGVHVSRNLTTRVSRILVESAALYSINNLLYCVLYSLEQQPESWFSGLDCPVASITFSLIIVRVEAAVNAPPTQGPISFLPDSDLSDSSGPKGKVRHIDIGRRGSMQGDSSQWQSDSLTDMESGQYTHRMKFSDTESGIEMAQQ